MRSMVQVAPPPLQAPILEYPLVLLFWAEPEHFIPMANHQFLPILLQFPLLHGYTDPN